MLTGTETEFPLWVSIIERIGPGGAILIFTFAMLFKLVPALITLLKAWKHQSETITDAVPKVMNSVDRIATNMERGFERLNERIYGHSPGHHHQVNPVWGDRPDSASDGGAGHQDLSHKDSA